ncbi:MAG: DUF1501 domain-containing protein [Candidatus Kapaibacterium sp.]
MRRRDFLKRIPPVLATPFALHGLRLQGLAETNRLYEGLAKIGETDRVLLIIQLEGGNDGLNTVIPFEDAIYYNARPNLAVAKEEVLRLNGQPLLGMNPVMEGMASLFNDGELAIVQNIGYDQMNLSHFTGTEIWNTASGWRKDEFLNTGWVGRYLAGEYPDFPDVLPDDPPAIEISPATSSIFTVVGASIAMSLTDPQEFYDLVSAGPNVSDEVDVTTLAGREWEFIDLINRQSITFADTVRSAATKAENQVTYPDTDFARSLAIVARLVAGGLGTRIYKVRLGNFDTHGGQALVHPLLLRTLSDGVKAFQDDLHALNVADRVVGITYSEFGRRVGENGPGTDHGTAAPHFVFGSGVNGGEVFGNVPDLVNVDRFGNLPHELDFYCYYASVIAPFFNVDDTRLKDILPLNLCDRSSFLPLYRASSVKEADARVDQLKVVPNPVSASLFISLPVALHGAATLHLALYDGGGRVIREEERMGLESELVLNVEELPSGTYYLEIRSGMHLWRGDFMVVR